jgi:hypothetical protein
MALLKYMTIPFGILVVAVIYWFVSDYDWIGSVLLVIFAIAMAVMGWVLVPTLSDVGPTAPVDTEWHEHRGS